MTTQFTRFAAQCDDGVGPFVVAGTEAAVVVRAGAASGDEEQVALGIYGHDGPSIARAAAPGRVFAFRRRRRGIGGERVPAPAKSARAGVVSAHNASGHVHSMIVVDGGADDDQVVNDGGRGSHVVPAGVVLQDVVEADLALLSEVGAGRAGCGIHRDEASVLCGLEDAAKARLVLGASGVEPGGNAAIDEAVAIVAIEVDLRIVGPALLSGFGVEGDDAVESGGEVESAVNEKGGGLEAAALSSAAILRNVSGVKGPGNFQSGDVVAIDLGKWGEAHAARVVAVVRPGITGGIREGWRRGPREKPTSRQKQNEGIRRLGSMVHS